MIGPVEHGGGGASLTTAYRVVREIAKFDASVAMLLGYSYIWSVMPTLVGTPEQRDRLAAEGDGATSGSGAASRTRATPT